MRKTIAASILNADFGELAYEISSIERVGDTWLHLDVMDGNFVNNLSYGPGLIASLRSKSKLFFDVHLMIADPLKYSMSYIEAGADLVSFHYEAIIRQLTCCLNTTCCCQKNESKNEKIITKANEEIVNILKLIKKSKIKCGLAINPQTKVELIESLLADVDLINVMSVEPGFGGQKFIQATFDKVNQLATIRDRAGLDFIIEVDGGVCPANSLELFGKGADVLVAGSYIFNSNNYKTAINSLR